MAIARGAGTEIIRSAHFEDIDSGDTTLLVGVQHHIYTILSVIINAKALQASGNEIIFEFVGYDSKGGTSAQTHTIFRNPFTAQNQTFVWNDKFSFNGYEPVDFASGLDATKQDAIADQGSSVAQFLKCSTTHADDSFEIMLTYIDQNNA